MRRFFSPTNHVVILNKKISYYYIFLLCFKDFTVSHLDNKDFFIYWIITSNQFSAEQSVFWASIVSITSKDETKFVQFFHCVTQTMQS